MTNSFLITHLQAALVPTLFIASRAVILIKCLGGWLYETTPFLEGFMSELVLFALSFSRYATMGVSSTLDWFETSGA